MLPGGACAAYNQDVQSSCPVTHHPVHNKSVDYILRHVSMKPHTAATWVHATHTGVATTESLVLHLNDAPHSSNLALHG